MEGNLYFKALQLEGNLPFLLCFTLYLRAISKYKPPGGLNLEGRFNRGFLHYEFGGLIFGGLYLEGLIFGILQYGTKLKKLVNGKRISVRNIPTGKTGLPFQNFHLYREFSCGTNQENLYHLHPNRNFRDICGKR